MEDEKYFLAVIKELNLYISFLLTDVTDYGLYGRIDDHCFCVFNVISNLYQVDLRQHNVW